MIFESHAHLDDEAFDKDREELLGTMQEQGIERILNVCAEVESWDRTRKLMEEYPFVYGAVGAHPNDVDSLNEDVIQKMHQLCRLDKMAAVGEIGLDYYWHKENRDTQIYWFERQLCVAREEKLPVIVHSREAAKDTLDVMKQMHAEEIGGVEHCFSYEKEMAREYLNLGFLLGIGGVITYKNGRKLREVVEYAPLESLLLETDCPYLSPVPLRGKRNSSLNLPYVVAEIAAIKGVSDERVMEVTRENAYRLFGKVKR